jgi:hypothetical protein
MSQRRGITYFRLLQLLVERPLAITVDDVQLLRLLALKDNIQRHLVAGGGDSQSHGGDGPAVLRSMSSRALERASPGTPYFVRSLQITKIAARYVVISTEDEMDRNLRESQSPIRF